MSKPQRDQVLTCTDAGLLDGWIDRALQATSIDDIFAEGT